MDENILYATICDLAAGANFEVENGVIVKWNSDNIQQPTQEQITNRAKEIEEQARTDNAYSTLQTLCDTKSQDAKNYINGAKVTSEQLARYEEKYEIAKAFKADGSHLEQLQLEADLVRLTVTELADLIIAKGDAYKQALVTFNARIEAFRVKVRSLIADGQLDSVNLILETAKDFDITTTDDEIKALFV